MIAYIHTISEQCLVNNDIFNNNTIEYDSNSDNNDTIDTIDTIGSYENIYCDKFESKKIKIRVFF